MIGPVIACAEIAPENRAFPLSFAMARAYNRIQ